jgi:hypothetical protein
MDLIKVTDGQPQKYTYRQFKLDNPRTSFPKLPDAATLAPYGLFPVSDLEQPAYDSAAEVCTKNALPHLEAGAWVYGWTVRDKTADEIAAAKAAVVAAVQAEMSRRMRMLAEDYEETERETWPTQVDEAKAIKAGGTTAPLLQPLATAKGRTLAEQADRVLYLSATFAAASGAIMAARDVLLQADPIPDDYQDDRHWT